jgi:hypothetical protein
MAVIASRAAQEAVSRQIEDFYRRVVRRRVFEFDLFGEAKPTKNFLSFVGKAIGLAA